jgi:hypothetical protein
MKTLWHIFTVEIAIAIGVEFFAFSSISVPIPIWIPIAAVIIRIAGTPSLRPDGLNRYTAACPFPNF